MTDIYQLDHREDVYIFLFNQSRTTRVFKARLRPRLFQFVVRLYRQQLPYGRKADHRYTRLIMPNDT